MKFYPRDWRGDQALRAVSIAARGLWMECLCIMHEAKPYGHLMLNGKPVGDDALARMTGASVDEVSGLMSELRQAGAFSVTREGVIFSRRMTKDHARASKGRKAVQKRWAQADENKEENDTPNSPPNREPITQKPETRNQNTSSLRSEVKLIDREFEEEFWPNFPRKVGKGQALKAYRTARKHFDCAAICGGAARYAAERRGADHNFTKHPATWLNGQCWDDEPAPPPSPRLTANAPPRERTLSDALRDRIGRNDHEHAPTIDGDYEAGPSPSAPLQLFAFSARR